MWILNMADSSASLFKRKTYKEKLGSYFWLQKVNSFWGWTWLFSGDGGGTAGLLTRGRRARNQRGCGGINRAGGHTPVPSLHLTCSSKTSLLTNLRKACGFGQSGEVSLLIYTGRTEPARPEVSVEAVGVGWGREREEANCHWTLVGWEGCALSEPMKWAVEISKELCGPS